MTTKHRDRSLLAAVTMVGLVLAATGCCRALGSRLTPVYRTAMPFTIDGNLDEPAWQEAFVIPAYYDGNGQGKWDQGQFMAVRLAWDENFLYLGYQLWDTNIVALSDGREKGPAGNRRRAVQPWAPDEKVDCTEFFVSFGDLRFMWELQHNAANHFNDVFLNVLDPAWPIYDSEMNFLGLIMNDEQYVKDAGQNTVKTAVQLQPKADGKPSTVNDPKDTDTGYTAELRFPWGGLGAPKSALAAARAKKLAGWDLTGRELVLLAVVLNGNDGPNYHHTSPTRAPKGMFAVSASHFPRYVFREAKDRK